MTRADLTFQSRSIILRIILYSLLYFFREDYSQHINIKSNLKRVSTFLLIFHVVFSDSSYSLLLRRLLLPKTFFSCLYFSLIPFSSHNLFYILRWWIFFGMDGSVHLLRLGLQESNSQKLLSPCARTLCRFQITSYWKFFALRRFFSPAKRRIACTSLGNPKLCFTLH